MFQGEGQGRGVSAPRADAVGHDRAALSDGESLYAIRYSSDTFAPSLWYRWSESRKGMAVVSEPLEAEEGGWIEVPPSTFCTFIANRVEIQPFLPCSLKEAA